MSRYGVDCGAQDLVLGLPPSAQCEAATELTSLLVPSPFGAVGWVSLDGAAVSVALVSGIGPCRIKELRESLLAEGRAALS